MSCLEEGVVHSTGSVRTCRWPNAQGTKPLAFTLISGLSVASESLGLPLFPAFNEVTWTFYPDHKCHITAHRDPDAYEGVIAVFTLKRAAKFRDGVLPSERATTPGDIVLLAGHGWPTADSRCPRHEVEPPGGSDRMIMTMRFNGRGAVGGYDV